MSEFEKRLNEAHEQFNKATDNGKVLWPTQRQAYCAGYTAHAASMVRIDKPGEPPLFMSVTQLMRHHEVERDDLRARLAEAQEQLMKNSGTPSAQPTSKPSSVFTDGAKQE